MAGRDFQGELRRWFLTMTRWHRIGHVVSIQKVEAEQFPDAEQARRVLLDVDSAYICLLLASTGETASVGQLARAIATERTINAVKRARQRIRGKIGVLTQYGLVEMTPRADRVGGYRVGATEFLVEVLQEMLEAGDDDVCME